MIETKAQGRTYAKITVKALEHNAAGSLATNRLRSAVDITKFFAEVIGIAPPAYSFGRQLVRDKMNPFSEVIPAILGFPKSGKH